MMVVVAFSCAVGGWFVGCVSGYLIYRFTESPPRGWHTHWVQYGDPDPCGEVELKAEPPKLQVVRGDS